MKPTFAQDAAGGFQIDKNSLFAMVNASIEALTARELFSAQQIVSEATHKITIRWLAGVKANMNVWFDNRQFQIQAIQNPDERRKMLVLLCIERDNSAREQGGSAL